MYAFKGFFIEPQILNLVEKILVLIFSFLIRLSPSLELLGRLNYLRLQHDWAVGDSRGARLGPRD